MRLSALVSTGTLARASARHPWRTIGAWVAVFVAAIVFIVSLLGGSLTTEGEPTNNPESERAITALVQAFPPDPSRSATDIVVVRSEELTADSPQFESFVRALVDQSDAPISTVMPRSSPPTVTRRSFRSGSRARTKPKP